MGFLNRKSKYYSLKNILKYKATYNVIFGERSNGKTYAALKHGVVEYFKTGGQLAYIRRWKEDITGKRASKIFNGLNQNGEIKRLSNGEFDGVVYRNGAFYLTTYDENGDPVYNERDIIGYVFALSDSEHNKSLSYPNVTNIIFDEFLTKHTYLTDEFVLFMNTISTIVRQRTDVTIFMLGNTVNKFSPYFKEMGLTHINNMKQGGIDLYRYGDSSLTVAVEYTASTENFKENNFYFAFNNQKLEMITGGAWELSLYPHAPMKWKPKDVSYIYFIEYNQDIYQCEIIFIDDYTFTFIHEKTTPIKYDDDIVYSLDFKPDLRYNRSIGNTFLKIHHKILWYFKNDKVFYQNNEVGHAIDNFLKESGI